eukprot:6192483-Pleurochrysis_carterae.AAC.2
MSSTSGGLVMQDWLHANQGQWESKQVRAQPNALCPLICLPKHPFIALVYVGKSCGTLQELQKLL